jgi:hypothetical protein
MLEAPRSSPPRKLAAAQARRRARSPPRKIAAAQDRRRARSPPRKIAENRTPH